MNIAVTAKGSSLEAPFDERFGRASYFIIIDSDSGEIVKEFNNEQNLNAVQGSGIESSKVLADLDVSVLLSGHVGPKALEVLIMGKISAYKVEASTVQEAFTKFKAKDVTLIHEADVATHWNN